MKKRDLGHNKKADLIRAATGYKYSYREIRIALKASGWSIGGAYSRLIGFDAIQEAVIKTADAIREIFTPIVKATAAAVNEFSRVLSEALETARSEDPELKQYDENNEEV